MYVSYMYNIYEVQRCTVSILIYLHVVCVCVWKYIAMLLFFLNVHANF